ncbi:MAG: TIGR02530 family flagellar biosynthesis protein [Syntrophomonadaceae bacterium]|nr:TIGR02530 family flagellar biosynthesis protein [Syntrophomonadaceae bacterium]
MTKINQYYPLLPEPPVSRNQINVPKTETGPSFKELLHRQLPAEGIKFSSHCLKRLEQNRIQVSAEQLDKLNSAVDKAESKGSRESCIVLDDMAFIVSINNRTVITVVDGPRMKDNVFTNIDSAVIV